MELASLGFRSDDGVTLGVPLGAGLYELHSVFTLMVLYLVEESVVLFETLLVASHIVYDISTKKLICYMYWLVVNITFAIF